MLTWRARNVASLEPRSQPGDFESAPQGQQNLVGQTPWAGRQTAPTNNARVWIWFGGGVRTDVRIQDM
jgi:hypothetical protein